MCWAFGLSFVTKTARVIIISPTGHRLLNYLKFEIKVIGLSGDLKPFSVSCMDKLDGSKYKDNCFSAFYETRNKFSLDNDIDFVAQQYFSGRPTGWLVGPVREELNLKPTQPPIVVGLGLGRSLAIRIIRINTNINIKSLC